MVVKFHTFDTLLIITASTASLGKRISKNEIEINF